MARAKSRWTCQNEAVVSLGSAGDPISILPGGYFNSSIDRLILIGRSLLEDYRGTRFTLV